MAGLEDTNAEFLKPYMTVIKYFRCAGIDVFDQRNVLHFKFKYMPVIIYLVFIITALVHWLYVFHALNSGLNLVDFSLEIAYCNNNIEYLIIYLYLCLIKGRIKNYVMKLQKLWRNDDSLLPEGILLKRNLVKEMDSYSLNFCRLLAVFMYFYLGSPLVTILIKKMLGQDVPYVMREKFTLPFDYQNNIVIFAIVYIIDYSIVWTQVFTVYGGLFFLSVSINQLRTLFLLVQEDFKTIIETRDVDIDVKLKHTIQNHSKLLDMLAKVGDAYGGIFAIHIFFLCITICFYGIAVKINRRLEDVKNFTISVLVTVIIYYGCQHGQLATDSALDVATVIYDSPWEDLSISNRKIILLIILRSQHATYIRSTSFTEVSLNTFKAIMNTTYSFISLIVTMYEK